MEGQLGAEDIIVPSVDREKKHHDLPIAISDRVRFGETLSAFEIRNGTRGFVSAIVNDPSGSPTVSFTLEDGRTVTDRWSAFARRRPGRAPASPRISHGYAGTAYAAQGRTVGAAVMYVAQPTDAREVYVGLTRHTQDARVIVEQTRLDAAVRTRQTDPRLTPSKVAILERLFVETQVYAEKQNVIDFIEDRAAFIVSGHVSKPVIAPSLDVIKAIRAVRQGRGVQVELGERIASAHILEILRRRLRAIIRPLEARIRAVMGKPATEIERSPSPSPSAPDYSR